MDSVAQRLVARVKPLVPLSVKRTVKRRIPPRYHGYFDPDWHRRTIGYVEEWDEHGEAQLDYLTGQGLKPHHHLLDIGCGPLRGGVHFIRYLETGRYVGVDKNAAVLDAARDVELERYGLREREASLVAMENFDFPSLGRTFDFAWAQSVFTHLVFNSIIRCVMNVEKVLADGGRFYATFYENEQGKFNLDPIRQSEQVTSYFDRDPYHYDLAAFESICDGTRMTVRYLGGWNNPRNQKMLVFRKAG
ncbi:MAG: class I SAM-dependent methyltransferase [Actinomycetota bacterium]|nr:class I SAM-dependent methyltransferase [Actinomycetota bacterium]